MSGGGGGLRVIMINFESCPEVQFNFFYKVVVEEHTRMETPASWFLLRTCMETSASWFLLER